MRRLAPLFLAILVAGCASRFDLQGHRGARGLAPENTLPAFAAALAIGVTTLELDTAITRDGVVVVSHDPWLNPDLARDRDGRWLEKRGPRIHDLDFDALAAYDVGRIKPGSRYARDHPQQVPVDGTRIPKLAEVFDLVKRSGNRSVRFNIETKVSPLDPDAALAPAAFVERLVEAIRVAGMGSRSTIQSFDWRTLLIAQKLAPEMPTVYLTARQKFFDNICAGAAAGSAHIAATDCETSPWTAGFQLRNHGSVPKMIKAAGGRVWSPFFRDIDAGSIKEAHGLGLAVVVWTVNDPADIQRMLELGVDGLITDRPDIALPLVKKSCQARFC